MEENQPRKGFTDKIKDLIRKKQDGVCADCGSPPSTLEVHHKKPQHHGGSDDESNAVGLCPSCHQDWDHFAEDGIYWDDTHSDI